MARRTTSGLGTADGRRERAWGRAPRRLGLGAASAIGLAAGCQSATPDARPVPWETKSQSILGRAEETTSAPLPMPNLYEAQGGPQLRAASIELLLDAATSSDPLLRANALEALQSAPEVIEEPLRHALVDENRGVRFVAVVTVGRLELRGVAPLVEPLLLDESDSVRVGAIYALRRCGRPVDISPLGVLVMSDSAEVKANTAMIIGALGEASALPMLREAVRKPLPTESVARSRIVELQFAEAMVRLGELSELEVIRAAVFAPDEQGELKVLACQLCGKLGDRTYIGALRDKALRTGPDQEAPEVRLAATQALVELDPAQARIDVPMEYLSSERPELRAQAAFTLGSFRDPQVLPALTAMLGDGNPVVQVSAAGAVLQATR